MTRPASTHLKDQASRLRAAGVGVALVLTASLGLTGCGNSSSTTSSGSASSPTSSPSATRASAGATSTPEAATAAIIIKDFAYKVPASVTPGAKVMITNDDSEAHTVTADGQGGFDVKIDPGATATLTAPSQAGNFPFHCTYHANMHGILKVS